MPRSRIRTRLERERDNAAELGDIYKFTRDPELAARRAEARRQRAQTTPYVRFVVCSIRGCKVETPESVGIAVCLDHAVEIWELVERADDNPYLRENLPKQIAARDAIRAEHREVERADNKAFINSPQTVGDIYYARVGTLIKVGWTTDLYERIRSYGPDTELLAHYKGTRSDETNLHRNLKPSRAKGREWYHDDPIIRAFVTRVIRQYGEPRFTETGWTRPKQVVAGKRHR